jgi:hypothetical protein
MRVGQLYLGWGSMHLVGIAVGVAAAGGKGGGGWLAATCQRQDGLVHSGCLAAHDVGTACVGIVGQAVIATRCACVSIVHVAAMGVAVVPIFLMLVGSGRKTWLLRAGSVAAKPGWLLWEVATAVAAAITSIVPTAIMSAMAIVGHVLLLCGGIDGGWGLLANSHAELLDACQLALHIGHVGCLGLDRFLRGSVGHAEVCERFTVRRMQRVVVCGSHAVAVLCSRDRRLDDERDCAGPVLLEGIDCLNERRGFALTSNPVLYSPQSTFHTV